MTAQYRFALLLYVVVQADLWQKSEGFVQSMLSRTTVNPNQHNFVKRFYKDDQTQTVEIEDTSLPPRKITKGKRAVIEDLENLDEIKYFLEDDERLSAIKFYAPWCKTCQRIGQQFDRLAMELGDGIIDRKQVEGQIRCGQVKCSSPESFISEQLYVMALPTIQLYYGSHKVWEGSGKTSIKELKAAFSKLHCLSPAELRSHAESVDDGILLKAFEDAFFSYPSFLDEEW